MIEGMKFHIKGDELKTLLAKRSLWHKERVVLLESNLKLAEDAMKTAAQAAAAAGPAPRRSNEIAMSFASARNLSVTRAHGNDMEDPVSALEEAVVFHSEKAAGFLFYSNHLVVETTYILTESEVARYELVAASQS